MTKQILLVLLLAVSFSAFAQNTPVNGKFNLAIEGLLPVGSAADIYNYGIGISGKFESPVSTSLNFTADVGLASLKVKEAVRLLSIDKSSSQLYIPVKAGLKYFFAPSFYGEGQIGAALATKGGLEAKYAYTPGIGVVIPIEFGNSFDIGLRYEGWVKDGDNLGFIALHAAFKFGK